MAEYVKKVTFELNGESITDFDEFTEDERELRVPVKLMNKTGFVKKQGLHTFSLKYVEPVNSPPYNFSGVKDGSVTIEKDGGKRITFTEVFVVKIGATTYNSDNDDPASTVIDFGAGDRVEE